MDSWKPVIRSLSFFIDTRVEWSRSELKDKVEDAVKTLEKAEERLRENEYGVWSKRVILPIPPVNAYHKIPDIIGDLVSNEYLLGSGCFFLEEVTADYLEAIVSNGAYVCLMYGREPDPVKYTSIVLDLAGKEPLYLTRLALSLTSTPVETPYLPLAASLFGEGIGVSFLLPRYLIQVFNKRGLRGIKKALLSHGKEVAELLGDTAGRITIDYSISPWMDDSVVELVEAITGYTPLSPGFLHGLWLLNNILSTIARLDYNAHGFNEVMLPYAEDSRLLEAGARGSITARDFLVYSSVCVAGPDMLVVPSERTSLLGYVRDALALGRVKGRYMGLRIVAVDASPGDKVSLGRFGEVAVIGY